MTEQSGLPQLPILRNLQFSPLKQGEEQFVVLWDPSGLSHERLVVPLNWFYLFQFFDGQHSLNQIGAQYLKKFGEFFMPDRLETLVAELDAKLFLEGARAEAARRAAEEAFLGLPVRKPSHSGRIYEADPEKLKAQLDGFYASKEGPPIRASENKGKRLKGLVAPHHAPKEAGPVYTWAYKELQDADAPDVFIVLGTCQAGLQNGISVTDKDFETPLGIVPVDRGLAGLFIDRGGAPFFEEQRAHLAEYSIEVQLPFLQHAMTGRRPVSILPVLVAIPPIVLTEPDVRDLRDRLDQFLAAMKATLESTDKHVCLVASAELAHIGMRYGDSQPPTDFSFHKCMQADMAMLKHVENLDADAFAQFILREGDTRRVSGFGVIYTLLKLIRAEKGQVLRYDRAITDQFNSTVTYCSMSFF